MPVASYRPEYGTTIALPSIVGANGVIDIILPTLTNEERDGLAVSGQVLRDAGQLAIKSAQ